MSAPVPKWGLRVFVPSPTAPDRAVEALAYAQFLREFLTAERVNVELDPDVDWQPDWGGPCFGHLSAQATLSLLLVRG